MKTFFKWFKTNFAKIQVAVIVIVIISFGFYGVHVRQYKVYKEYNGMRGTIASVFHARDCNLIDVRLDNGMYSSVNVGYASYKVGDTFINRVSYSRITGISGYAYFIVPNETRGIIEGLIVTLTYFCIILSLIIGYIFYIYKRW